MSHPSTSSSRPPFQFSLLWLLIVVTAVGVLLGLWEMGGLRFLPWLLTLLVWSVLPTPLLIAAIYSRGELRVFSVGALMPWAVIWFSAPALVNQGLASLLWLPVIGGISGALAVATRRWLARRELD